jgi:hypothetical protein
MEEMESAHSEQNHTPPVDQENTDGEKQTTSSLPEDFSSNQESQLSGEKQLDQKYTPPTLVCPYCSQEHPKGTLFCPITGKPLSTTSQPESGQVYPGITPQPQQNNLPSGSTYVGNNQQLYNPPPYYVIRPHKDRSIAIILEILPGLFGFLGFGWIYGGNSGAGIAWLLGFLFWDVIAVIIDVLTGGLGLFCTIPISLVCIGASTFMLNGYTKQNNQLFGP